MNEPKSSRYHRLRRRAGFASLAVSAAVLAAMAWARPPLPAALNAVLLALANALATLPVDYYREYVLDRRYELSSEALGQWLADRGKALLLAAAFASAAAAAIYRLIAWTPTWWWVPAAVLGALVALLIARLAPVLLLPLFYTFTPLERPTLTARLLDLSRRAGVPVLGVFVWGLGARTRRANAALVGSGATRRILLSDTMLGEYSEDEIEVILAHELAHHVHGDIAKGIVLEFVLLLGAGAAAAAMLRMAAAPLGLSGPADPAGLPLLALTAGAVMLAASPAANALSRWNERRADAFALALTGRGAAFATAMRRLGAQNLAEENPSRATVWLFHTHPPIEERIASALRLGDVQATAMEEIRDAGGS